MRRSRLGCLIVSMSLVGGATVAVTTSMTASAAPSVIRLHLGSDTRRFSLGTTTQSLTVGRNTCAINSAEPLIDLSSSFASGSQSAPGFVTDGIGVKASPSSGNGSPCSQVDAAERLTLRPGTTLPGRTFSSLRLDVEMAGNAIVVLTLSRGTGTPEIHKIVTGTSIASISPPEVPADLTAPYDVQTTSADRVSACAAPNSSGPNSGGSDNCRWTVTPTPGFNFDTVSLTTEIGTVALEGSGDFANDPNFDSLFYLSNSAPIATTDAVTTAEDTPVTFNVLANDTDGDGDPLSATILATPGPTNGTVVPAVPPATGFTYTPLVNYSGPDSFTYTVTDGTDSSIGTVNITVTPVNDAPVAVSGTSTTPEDTTVTLTVATDIDSTALTSSCTSTEGGTLDGNGNGSVTFTPPLNFTGSTTIRCSTTDGLLTTATSAEVTVGVSPVNDAPVANADSAEVNANDSVIINVVANDTDVDGDALVVGGVATAPTSGIAVPTGGSITYTPNADFTGTDSFTYTVTDGTATSGSATVTITVHPVICSNETVSDSDGTVSGSFTRLDLNVPECKRYILDANAAAGTVLFVPDGAAQVDYRGYLTFAPASAPNGALNLSLEYDPTGGTTFRPVLVCINPQFDGAGKVTSATLPAGESWCIASETTRGDANGDAVTTWQVFGRDDPRFQ